ncbi:MAG: dTDP-4-amino-4,6-dideoxygalactose transaminase [Marinilabiliales bacterium]|nr:MAG: dTDP-4-amino-4,6-dideoxygalactose transaminase [Marinilabiliales bacterium]
MKILLNKPYITSKEEKYIVEALHSARHSGNNAFGKKAIDHLKGKYGFSEIFLTPSCTSAMEMGALLANISPGDEVILPSYTFSSTVNAIVIFGGKPVFCEIDSETLNIDVTKIEELITSKTKMILPIDYAGISCEIDAIMDIANKHNLIVMQDCAQSFGGFFKGKPNGSIPHLAAFSFHETKNMNAGGEGGGLVVNMPEQIQRAYFMQEKGTDRRLVLDGVKSKYSWVEKGSSYLLSDILAAGLLGQLECEDDILAKRKQVTEVYYDVFTDYKNAGKLNIYIPQKHIQTNHHAFWVVFDTSENRTKFMSRLREIDIHVYIGYLPLHSSPMGIKFGYKAEDLHITESIASRVVRLPFYAGMADEGLEYTKVNMQKVLKEIYG